MDALCTPAADEEPSTSCLCRPVTHFDGIANEHYWLGLVQLLKAGYLVVWLRLQRRREVAESSSDGLRLLVLPVYARFLTIEAAQCIVWGAFYLWNSYYDSGDRVPHLATVIMQVARYLSSFTWAAFSEGVFFFLCFTSAGVESLYTAIQLGAVWGFALVACCGLVWVQWAGCSSPPESMLSQLLWMSAWVPYWMRLALMPLFYSVAALLMCALGLRRVAWERGALQLALFNMLMSTLFLVPKLYLGVFTSWWQVSDAIAMPLAWIAYTPFLLWVLQCDSQYWARCGFTACVMGDAAAATNGPAPHRVPLLAQRSGQEGGVPRFIIIEPSVLKLGASIGDGASSVVYAATLFGEPVAVKQMEVSRLTREFAAMFLTEAECLSHCRHQNIVRFVGGCVAPPLVCLLTELCDSSLHRLIHVPSPSRGRSCERLPDDLVCRLLRGVVSGLEFLHGTMGILHGDLKPLNILLKAGTVKLCDFGSSRLLQHESAELAFTGTLPYMAPELLVPLVPSAGAASTDEASRAVDVYSFGVCVWETCTRQFPWRKLLQQGLVHELKRRVGHEGERPPSQSGDASPPQLPRPLRLLVEACWRQKPAERPTFAQLASIDLEHLCTSAAAEQQLVDLVGQLEGASPEAAKAPHPRQRTDMEARFGPEARSPNIDVPRYTEPRSF